MRPSVIIPALDAARTIAEVLAGLRAELAEGIPIFVVDDGSKDGTARVAEAAGAVVLVHARNKGKGAAIRTGLRAAREAGCDVALTVDADGQHPAKEAAKVLHGSDDAGALVLGSRDLATSGAPKANLVGNLVANFFVSVFTLRRFRDTQCRFPP